MSVGSTILHRFRHKIFVKKLTALIDTYYELCHNSVLSYFDCPLLCSLIRYVKPLDSSIFDQAATAFIVTSKKSITSPLCVEIVLCTLHYSVVPQHYCSFVQIFGVE